MNYKLEELLGLVGTLSKEIKESISKELKDKLSSLDLNGIDLNNTEVQAVLSDYDHLLMSSDPKEIETYLNLEFYGSPPERWSDILHDLGAVLGWDSSDDEEGEEEDGEEDDDEACMEYNNAELDDALLLEPVGVVSGEFKLKINGAEYGYKPDPAKFSGDISALEKEFLYKMAYPGKALAWLKGATILSSRPGGHKVAQAPSSSSKVTDTVQIPASNGSGSYDCKKYNDGSWTCTCPHHMHRGVECKHIKAAQDQLNKGVSPKKIAASATGESKSIEFSPVLSRAIQMEVQTQAADLGDELDGVEEIIGDNLSGAARKEWDVLLKTHGFDSLTKAVKKKFIR